MNSNQVKWNYRVLGFFWCLWAAIAVVAVFLQGCGNSAQGGGSSAIAFPGPDGGTCYVVYDSGRAVGGNCVR